MLNAFSSSVFTTIAFSNPKAPKSRWKIWSKEDLLLVEEDGVRGHLNKLEIHKSVGPDGVHPQVLREVAHVILRPLSIIFEGLW